MRISFCKGVKAAEILVVFVILALFLSLCVKSYPKFVCISLQSEAKFALKEIYHAQKYYQEQYASFTSFENITKNNERIFLNNKYYTYADGISPKGNKFKIIAKGKESSHVNKDIWSIDESGNLTAENNVCDQ